MPAERKKKLAILGGGIGSLVTAWQLTSQPNWKEIYESITIYQMVGVWEASVRAAADRTAESKSMACTFGLAFTIILSM
jgi:hypothetical protein